MPAFPLRGTADAEIEVPSVENQSWHLFFYFFIMSICYAKLSYI